MFKNPLSVKIIGSGPTGALLSLSLANIGIKVTLYDACSKKDLLDRDRAYALTHSSRRLLENIGIWEAVRNEANAFSSLSLEDRGIFNHVEFKLNDLFLLNKATGAIGWIVEHKILTQILFDEIESDPNILFKYGESATPHIEQYDLVIAADGPNSPTRKSWKIPSLRIPYKQGCLAAKVVIRGASETRAHEILQPEGPLAILPMGGEVFQVVWSSPLEICRRRAQLSPGLFLDRLAAVLPHGFEPDLLLGDPVVFPMQFSIALGFGSGRKVLIGESAHRFHPVGGQGLNVCWRDIHVLENLLNKIKNRRLRISSLSSVFSRKRILDVLLVGLFTDLIVRLYSNRNPFCRAIRLFVMSGITRCVLLRRLLLHFMTDGPTKNPPKLSE